MFSTRETDAFSHACLIFLEIQTDDQNDDTERINDKQNVGLAAMET